MKSMQRRTGRCIPEDFGFKVKIMNKLNEELRLASAHGNVQACLDLLQRGADIDGQDGTGMTALMHAIESSHQAVALTLIDAGASVKLINYEGYSALHYAAIAGMARTAQALLDKGADPRLKCGKEGNPPLHLAAQHNRGELCTMLIAAGAQVKATNRLLETALHRAASSGLPQAGLILLKHGADARARMLSGATALHEAAIEQHADTLLAAALLAHGAQVDAVTENGSTALHYAARHNKGQLVEFLIGKGAQVDRASRYGRAPIHDAAIYGNSNNCQTLVRLGANAHAVDQRGATALHHAAFNSHPDCCEALVSLGLQVDAINENGETPLHQYSDAATCLALLQAGARWDIPDKNGNTALDVARVNARQEVVAVLQSWQTRLAAIEVLGEASQEAKRVEHDPVYVMNRLNEIATLIAPHEAPWVHAWKLMDTDATADVNAITKASAQLNAVIASHVKEIAYLTRNSESTLRQCYEPKEFGAAWFVGSGAILPSKFIQQVAKHKSFNTNYWCDSERRQARDALIAGFKESPPVALADAVKAIANGSVPVLQGDIQTQSTHGSCAFYDALLAQGVLERYSQTNRNWVSSTRDFAYAVAEPDGVGGVVPALYFWPGKMAASHIEKVIPLKSADAMALDRAAQAAEVVQQGVQGAKALKPA